MKVKQILIFYFICIIVVILLISVFMFPEISQNLSRLLHLGIVPMGGPTITATSIELGSEVNITDGTIIRLTGMNCNLTVVNNHSVDSMEVYPNYLLFNTSLKELTYILNFPYSYSPENKVLNITCSQPNAETTLSVNISDFGNGIKIYGVSELSNLTSVDWSSSEQNFSFIVNAPSGMISSTKVYWPYSNQPDIIECTSPPCFSNWNSTTQILILNVTHSSPVKWTLRVQSSDTTTTTTTITSTSTTTVISATTISTTSTTTSTTTIPTTTITTTSTTISTSTSTSTTTSSTTTVPGNTETKLYLNDTEGDFYYLNNTYANFTVWVNVSGTVYLEINISGWTTRYGDSPLTRIVLLNTTHNNTYYNITGYFPGNGTHNQSSQKHYAIVYVITTTIQSTTTTIGEDHGGDGGGTTTTIRNTTTTMTTSITTTTTLKTTTNITTTTTTILKEKQKEIKIWYVIPIIVVSIVVGIAILYLNYMKKSTETTEFEKIKEKWS